MPLAITEKVKLFDTMVSPILSYSSEIWGFHYSSNIENVHIRFLKQQLRVHSRACNTAVYGEFGRYPLYVLRQIRIVKFWLKVSKCTNSLMYKLMYLQDNRGNYTNNWTKNLIKLFNNIGLGYLWEMRNYENISIDTITRRIYDTYLHKWFSDLESFSKLQTYKLFKNEFCQERYLLCIQNEKHRIALSQLRCSAHRLAIEEGRYRNIERCDRLCALCNMKQVESEYHFLLVCPFYKELRNQYINRYYSTWPNIHKFKLLMSSENKGILRKLATFVLRATEARKVYLQS
jgi:hypothetical protein